MKGFVPPDPESNVSEIVCAVVYAPRKKRGRFPASCVSVCESEDQARVSAKPDEHRFAARVLGPSKSSEGQYIFYLVEWL